MFSLTTALLALALPSALAIESQVRRAPANCQSMGKGVLAFGANNLGIYMPIDNCNSAPETFLAFTGQRDAQGHQVLMSVTKDKQEYFEYFQCSSTPPGIGKGSVVYLQGYIESIKAPGYCITISQTYASNATLVSKPCNFVNNGQNVSQHENFEFANNNFYEYYTAAFLGNQLGPTNGKNTSYKPSIATNNGMSYLRLDYDNGQVPAAQNQANQSIIFDTKGTTPAPCTS